MTEATRGVADWGKKALIFEHRDENHKLIATHEYPYYICYLCPICKKEKEIDWPITAYWRVPRGTPPIPLHAMKIALNDVTANRFKFFDAGVIQGIEYYVADQDRDLEAPHKHSKYGYRDPYYLFNILDPQTNISLFIEEVNRRASEGIQPLVKGKARPKFRKLPERHYVRPVNLDRFHKYLDKQSKVEQQWYKPDYVVVCDKMGVAECFFYAAMPRRAFDKETLIEMGAEEGGFQPEEELGMVKMPEMAPANNPAFEYACTRCQYRFYLPYETFKDTCPKCGGDAYRRPYDPIENPTHVENGFWVCGEECPIHGEMHRLKRLGTPYHKQKENPVLISAPHAATVDPRHYEGHPHDTIVAELAVHLSEALQRQGIETKVLMSGSPREEKDMNRREGRGSPYREAIRKALRRGGRG